MAYAAIAVEGGFLPADLLDQIATGKGTGQSPADFGLEGRLSDAMQSAFSDARTYWEAFARRRATSKESATTLTRQAWMYPLLETLGFPPLGLQRAAIPAGGDTFPISHLAGADSTAPPVHIVGIGQSLERRESSRRSPHALVQEYLNRSDALWGIVTNGAKVRLLRDSTRIAHPTFIEFDLQGMIEGNLYNEFVLLYRLLHGSRFPRGAADAADSILERLYQEGIDAGGRVRKKLRDGVEEALNALGSGFLEHRKSEELRERLATGELTEAAYYRQLLRLVYRLLFLFVTEERRLLFDADRDAAGDRRAIYDRYYSASRLRERCERPFAGDPFSDLWPGLRATFGLFRAEDRAARLGLTALNGELFGAAACRDLELAECDNAHLLRAIYHLSVFLDEGEQTRGRRRQPGRRAVRRRVNYAGLDVEELGSVYESLLDLQPKVDLADTRPFQLVGSGERKQTGSYYTPSSLVHELVESALVPVLQDRLAVAKTMEERERAILEMTVCDAAAGSGHFLLAAARRMGRELAKVRTGEAEPTPADFRLAERDVIRSCIFAVDKNPLAVDLCKVALWIEGHATGLPLGFLDHHVKCGDSLVGVFDLDVLREGIPDDAYTPVTGDDRAVARAVKEANRRRLAGGQLTLGQAEIDNAADPLVAQAEDLRTLAEMPERTPGDVNAKADLYRALREEGTTWWQYRTACDLWTAAFFAPLVNREGGGARRWLAPTSEDVLLALDQPRSLHGQVVGEATAIGERVGFFHWPLEFPDVFASGGFDVVLGNPPWERIKLQEQEFFARRAPEIANAPNAAVRKRLIEQLRETNPALYAEFETAVRDAEGASKFLRGSGGYPLTGCGDINLYSVFSELNASHVHADGRAGMLVPTGIATDDTNKIFFASLVDNRRLISLYDFENREGLFPSVDSRMKFSMLTIGQPLHPDGAFAAAFFLTDPAQLDDPARVFTLSPAEIALLNPNTRTAPIFRTARDAEITKRLYRAAPVLVREGADEVNPWGVTFKTLFHMSNDSHLFRTREELEASGHTLGADGRFRGPEGTVAWERLYEAKMIHQYDHRFATYEVDGQNVDRARDTTLAEHEDPDFVVLGRYWVSEKDVHAAASSSPGVIPKSLMGFRNIARVTDERSAIFSAVPLTAVGHSLQVLLPSESLARESVGLLANFNSLALDFVVRQKLGGVNFSFFIVKQLPVLPPESYTPALLDLITPRVLELVYTAMTWRPSPATSVTTATPSPGTSSAAPNCAPSWTASTPTSTASPAKTSPTSSTSSPSSNARTRRRSGRTARRASAWRRTTSLAGYVRALKQHDRLLLRPSLRLDSSRQAQTASGKPRS